MYIIWDRRVQIGELIHDTSALEWIGKQVDSLMISYS